MRKNNNFYDTVDQIVSFGITKGILHLYTANKAFNGTSISINEKQVVNFGSCSYLGLEFHPALKAAAKAAVENYGTQFSESRAYVSLGLYQELEWLLEKIFDAPIVVAPTTTLAHIACIPVIVDDGDAVIMDQQVHNSVQTAVQIVKARGVHIELIRHNRMDLLETRIKELRGKHKKIWYLADGIYSMFGDCCPVDHIYSLMEQYPELHFYVDDAHGMSIHGTHGRGYVLSRHSIHPKMVMASSLNKAFASGGGVLVFGDKETARKVGTVGGPLLSSGPMQPASLGAAIAAARLHLGDEIITMQQQLKDNIAFTRLLLDIYQLPVISEAGAAIFFVGASLPRLGHNIVKRMLDAGFYVNLGVFPTVPMKQTGIRFTITRLHTFKEIENMISTLADIFPVAMKEEGITLPEIYKAFKVAMPGEIAVNQPAGNTTKQNPVLVTEHYNSILDIDKNKWDHLFKGKGTFDWECLALLESTFSQNELPEDNWTFDYFIVKDRAGNIIAATFLTTSTWKDDMLSPGIISRQIEVRRKNEPYYLTSKVICSGSLITEGEHLYINTRSSQWKGAMQLLFEKIYTLQELYKANHIVLRDFHTASAEMDNLMVDNGFFKIQMPESHVINNLSWSSPEEFHDSLSANSRKQLRKKVLRNEDQFITTFITDNVPEAESSYWYQLYLNVKNKSFELNTFALPFKFFNALLHNNHWEVIQLTLKTPVSVTETKPSAVVFCYKTKDTYIPMIIGLDYTHNKEQGVYRQALYQVIKRAKQLGKTSIQLGFSAATEKQKMGAKPIPAFAYMHIDDSYNLEAMATLSLQVKSAV